MSENSIMTLADFNIETMTAQTAAAIEKHTNLMISYQTAAAATVEFYKNLKEMRDSKLYLALNFATFEDYTEQACGIKRRQAYNYIQTYEKLGKDFLQSNAHLGITKLQMLTEVCSFDRDEFVENNDIDKMSVAEVRRLVDENMHKGEQINLLQDELKETKTEQEKTIERLMRENEELKNRPIEVAVEQPSKEDIEAAAAERTKSLEEEFAEREKKLKAEHKEKLAAAKERVQKKADIEKANAVNEARISAKAEAEAEFKLQIEKAEKEKAEAIRRAEEMASRLDKNADAELVKASTFFSEAQIQLDKFVKSANMISDREPKKGSKLKKVACDFLKQLVDTLN